MSREMRSAGCCLSLNLDGVYFSGAGALSDYTAEGRCCVSFGPIPMVESSW